MHYVFGDFALDSELGELSLAGEDVQIEPRAFALLCHLLSNANRLVTKDELIEVIWDGRIVTDSAISTLVKTVRRTIGDDGKSQRLIRTVHGRGFRFVGSLTQRIPATTKTEDRMQLEEPPLQTSRPSIAVLPFKGVGDMQGWEAMADAVPAELISSLSRLKWLRVLARGSTFRFRDAVPDMAVIRTNLGAAYCLAGNVEIIGRRVSITAELSDTRDGQVIWGENFAGSIDDIHQIRTELVRLICSGLELHINNHETERARLRPPESLDAWSLYHLGLHHMYRFTAKDNAIAAGYLEKATQLDPQFARAFAARSFTSFQSVFVGYGSDRAVEVDNARRFAEKCLEIDQLALRQFQLRAIFLAQWGSRIRPDLSRTGDRHEPELCTRPLCTVSRGHDCRPGHPRDRVCDGRHRAQPVGPVPLRHVSGEGPRPPAPRRT